MDAPNASSMRRWETFIALAAVVLASVGSLRMVPWHHLATIAAVVLILAVGASRIAAALSREEQKVRGFDPSERAKQIRERRKRP